MRLNTTSIEASVALCTHVSAILRTCMLHQQICTVLWTICTASILNSYAFQIEVRDSGPQQSVIPAIATVNVTVLDANDNAPAFDRTSYLASATDNSSVPQALFTVQTTDADIGSNANVTYRISAGNVGDVFTIGTVSGAVSLVKPIPSTLQTYQLTINATDHGSPPLHSTVTATVSITQRAYFDFAVNGFGYAVAPEARGSSFQFGFFAGVGSNRNGSVTASLGKFSASQPFSLQRRPAASAVAVVVETDLYADFREVHFVTQVRT